MSSLKTPKGSVRWYDEQSRRIRYFYNHLEWPPKIMGFIHSRNVCQKEVITFSRIWEECTQEEAWLIIKRREDGRKWRSSSHYSKNIPQAMRNMKNSILEDPLIHLEHLDKKWCCYKWRRWSSWRLNKESTHETNKDKYSIIISWYCFGMHLFIFRLMCYAW